MLERRLHFVPRRFFLDLSEVFESRFGCSQVEPPQRAIEKAVKGMLPHNKLGRQQIKKLKVYKGADHPHAAQNPKPYEISQVAQ